VPASARPVVLVTGAAKRLGRAIARELATHGWNLAVHYRSSADEAAAACRELQELGAQALAFGADLADER
jgi:NAD(P)-dependent dehydrogenase (short-subunit alcohol dehydrogenase family)